MKVGFLTYGCKVNRYDTEAMREALERAGFSSAGESETPDVFVINSCTVTAESDRKTRQAVRKYRKLYPDAVIVLTGCMPRAFPEESESLEEADIVIGDKNPQKLVRALLDRQKSGQRIADPSFDPSNESFWDFTVSDFRERTRAYIKIQDGCDRRCAYCIIPTARGAVRSKPLADIRNEAERLSQDFREVVLVGINLTSYGREFGLSLPDAVRAVADAEGIRRIRLGSLEPDRLSDETLDRLADIEKLCPHFHISLQSGCDETLRRMKRGYNTALYADLCRRIRARFPDAALTTDVMVGFPGETDEEFRSSLSFVERTAFARVHVFAYSRRKGTPAAEMPNQIPNKIKHERARIMAETAEKSARLFLENLVGQTTEILVETDRGGYTANYVHVRLTDDESAVAPRIGESATVRITGIDGADAVGCLTD